MTRVILLLVLGLFNLFHKEFLYPAFAQDSEEETDSQSNKNFYPHNYAKSTFGDKNQGNNGPKPTPAGAGSIEQGASGSDAGQRSANAVSINPLDKSSGKKVESLSLIENGLDFNSIEKSTETLLRIFNEKSVRPSTVFLVGQSYEKPSDVLNSQIRRLALIGAGIDMVESPPENFKVTKLPSWILTTKEGDIVLEGIKSPEKFLNSKGEFVDPDKVAAGHDISGGTPELGEHLE